MMLMSNQQQLMTRMMNQVMTLFSNQMQRNNNVNQVTPGKMKFDLRVQMHYRGASMVHSVKARINQI